MCAPETAVTLAKDHANAQRKLCQALVVVARDRAHRDEDGDEEQDPKKLKV